MKTLLINPDPPRYDEIGGYSAFPMGLGYIAAVLEKEHQVEVLDIGIERLDNGALEERIAQVNPQIVGITSDTITFQRAIEVATVVKRTKPEAIVVVGGPHANVWPDYPLKYDCFDISVYGEGERTAVELWRRIERGESYGDVRGIAFRKSGAAVVNPRRELIANLDELPFPAWHLLPLEKYHGELSLSVRPFYPVSTSRGCPFSCSFCSNNVVFGRMYRYRGPQNVVDEIGLLISRYGARGIYFREDLFTANRKRVLDICGEIGERGLRFKWACESRVDTINEEMLQAMKRAGCEVMWFGVESGCPEVLEDLNKRITLPGAREAFRLCRKVGIRAGASFMIGVPGETVDKMHQTIEFARELRPDFTWFNIYTGYPTSPLYEHVVENKLYSEDIGHGVLFVKTDEFDREKLKRIQRYADRRVSHSLKRLVKVAMIEQKRGDLTLRKVIRGIKYYFGRQDTSP